MSKKDFIVIILIIAVGLLTTGFLYNLKTPIFGSTIRGLSPFRVSGTYIVPRVSTWKVGTSTVDYYGETLNISGTTTFNGINYNWPSSDGSSGYVLKTDGSGGLTWQVDNTGGGGGSGLWATSTFGIYPVDSSYDVVIGDTTTTSAPFWMDVSTGDLTISGNLISADNFLTTVDISDDTNLTAGSHLTLSDDTLNVDDDFLLNTGDTATGNYNFDSGTLYIDATNNRIGIGTTTPEVKLHLKAPDGTRQIRVEGDNGYTDMVQSGQDFYYKKSSNSGSVIWQDSSGNNILVVYVGSKRVGVNGLPTATLTAKKSSTYDLLDLTNSTAGDIMKVTNAGNVGIGTTTPAYKLDVNGTFRVSGTTTLSLSNGFLKVDASGQVSTSTIDISDNTNLAVSGTLLQLSGDTLSIKEGTLTSGKLCKYDSTDGLVCNYDDQDTTYSAGTGLDLTGTTFSLSHLGLESLTDPNANRLYYWNDTNNTSEWLDYSNWDTDKTDDLTTATTFSGDVSGAYNSLTLNCTNCVDISDETNLTATSGVVLTDDQLSIGSGNWIKILTQTANNDTSIEFTTGIDSTYDEYLIAGTNIKVSVDGAYFRARISHNNGSSYVGDGFATTSYKWGGTRFWGGGGTHIGNGSDEWFEISNGVGNDPGENLNFEFYLYHPSDTTTYKEFKFDGRYSGTDGNFVEQLAGGKNDYSTSSVNAVKFFVSSGYITSGDFTLFGRKRK